MAENLKSYDFIIIGAGIVGLTLARKLSRQGHRRICILEKEAKIGMHSSGRNSGVLHAGIYYGSDSLKAKVCATGSRLMQEYAAENGIKVDKTGKVIVCPTPELLPQVDVLFNRAKANRIRIEKIDLRQLRELEPEATSVDSALYSPDTAVIDSKAVLACLEKELTAAGVEIHKGVEVRSIDALQRQVLTSNECFGYGHLINCAGLHADKIAHTMGVGRKYRILPFKGIYKKLRPEVAKRFRGSIYPVPDLRVPFLGVHITRNAYDDVLVGPTAIPAFSRENYGIVQGLRLAEMPGIVGHLSTMFLRNQDGFRRMVFEELPKYRRRGLLGAAKALAPVLEPSDLLPSGKVGLRAQLVDVTKMKLVMDFVVESGPDSTHILNAVSPAFTGSFAFADLVIEERKL